MMRLKTTLTVGPEISVVSPFKAVDLSVNPKFKKGRSRLVLSHLCMPCPEDAESQKLRNGHFDRRRLFAVFDASWPTEMEICSAIKGRAVESIVESGEAVQ